MSNAPSFKRQPEGAAARLWKSSYDEQVPPDAATVCNRSGIEINPLYAPPQTDGDNEYVDDLTQLAAEYEVTVTDDDELPVAAVGPRREQYL